MECNSEAAESVMAQTQSNTIGLTQSRPFELPRIANSALAEGGYLVMVDFLLQKLLMAF